MSILYSLKKAFLIAPHPAGIPFIIGGVIATLVLCAATIWLAGPAFVFTLFCLYFFRDPKRMVPQKASLVIAPGDGVVSAIVPGSSLPAEIAEGDTARYTRVSIFLSVLDVHVNRVPVSGTVFRKVYNPGKFFNADLDKASEHNERCSVLIRTADGLTFGLVQIAGLIARRILNDLAEGQGVTAGNRFGIIRFGSRVDVYLPDNVVPLVCVGQRAVGGETVLADIESKEQARTGVLI
jgi:phosphatidylserine decarboxylase